MINEIRLRTFTSQVGEDNEVLSRDPKQNAIEYEGDTGPNTRLVEDVAFNKKLGVLTFIRNNGEVIEASGFLTEDQIGHGPKGKVGRIGKAGRDGEEGRLGKEGPAGCEGAQGNAGDKGMSGRDGEDGPVGIAGTSGCEGDVGPEGDEGDKGPKGFQGSMGKDGLDCIIGCPGPKGEQGLGTFVVQKETPTEEHVYLWGVPFESVLPELPKKPDDMSASINSIVVTMTKDRGTTYTASGSLIVSDFKGGVGPFSIIWTGDYKAKLGITKDSISNDSLRLSLDASAEIEPGEVAEIAGDAVVTITDTSNGKQLVLPTTYEFKGSNSTVVAPPIYGNVRDAAVVEGDDLKFLVTTTSPLLSSVRITYTLKSGTAGTSDYKDLGQGYMDLSIGVDQFYVNVEAIRDSIPNEDVETMSVTVSIPGVSELNAGDMTAIGTITEADSHIVPIVLGPAVVTEGSTAKITIRLGGSYIEGVTGGYAVKYRTLSDTAGTSDYVARSGTLTFTYSWEEKVIEIATIDDSIVEATEQFYFELYDAGAHLDLGGDTKKVTVTVNDNDETYRGSTGGGCIGWGAKVETPEGTTSIETVLIGDTILGYAEPSMSTSANSNDPEVLNWHALELRGKRAWVMVTNARHDTYPQYKVINDLNLTFDHPVMTKRDGVWQWLPALQVIVSDIVLGTDSQEVPVTIATEVYKELKVVELDVEPHDVYYVNDILVHNVNKIVHK